MSLLGNERYLPKEDIVLFLEDLNEPLYKIDKMLYQIYRCEILRKHIKGLIFGDFYFKEDDIFPLLKEYSKFFDIPSYFTFDISHNKNNVTIAYGKEIAIK